MDIEEERRLAYVAFTRAKDNLVLSSAKWRSCAKWLESQGRKSRFLSECGIIEKDTKRIGYKQENSDEIQKNDLVFHKAFGTGRVEKVIKDGANSKLQINFGGIVRPILSNFVVKVIKI